MIGTALALILLQTAPASPTQPFVPPPSASWPALPMLGYRATPVMTPEVTRFVRTEVESGRCAAATRNGAAMIVHVDLLVLTTETERVRRVTPIAIRCPAVEQYAAGLVTGLARDNLVGQAPGGGWYRTGLTFSWTP